MKLSPTPDRRATCKAKNIDEGSCFMKRTGYTVYFRTADRTATGNIKAYNMENGKVTNVDPDTQVYIVDTAELAWSFRERS